MTKWPLTKMTVLGFHVALSVIVCVVWRKLGPTLSPSQYLERRIVVYFVAEERDEVEQDSGTRKKKKKGNAGGSKIFLGLRHLTKEDCQSLPFHTDFRILLDLTCATVFVFACTWLLRVVMPWLIAGEANLALLWVAVLAAYCSKAALSITALFFQPTVKSEGEICVACAVGGFVCSVCVLSVGGDDVAHGLPQGILSIHQYTSDYISPGALGVIVHVILSLVAGVLGGVLVFPSFRLAQQHCKAVEDGSIKQMLMCHLHMCTLLLAALLQIRPVVRYVLQELLQLPADPQYVQLLQSALLAVHLAMRALLAATHTQSYLNTTLSRLPRPAHKRGTAQEVDAAMQAVQSVSGYLGVVLLQYCVSAAVLACGLMLQTGLAHDMARWPLLERFSNYLLNYSVVAMSLFCLVGMAYFGKRPNPS